MENTKHAVKKLVEMNGPVPSLQLLTIKSLIDHMSADEVTLLGIYVDERQREIEINNWFSQIHEFIHDNAPEFLGMVEALDRPQFLESNQLMLSHEGYKFYIRRNYPDTSATARIYDAFWNFVGITEIRRSGFPQLVGDLAKFQKCAEFIHLLLKHRLIDRKAL